MRGGREFLLAPMASLRAWAAARSLSLGRAQELALEAGVPTKTHVLNLLHRLIDGKPFVPPTVNAPQALTLTNEPKADVERYDALRETAEARHAS